MARPVVEIHVPLGDEDHMPEDVDPFRWFTDIEVYLVDLDPGSGAEYFGDEEELEESYAFAITGDDEKALLAVAAQVAALPGVPVGVFAMVTDDQSPMGSGRRVELQLT